VNQSFDVYKDRDTRELALKAFPEYRGRKVKLEVQSYPLNCASYWSGGSRSYFRFVRLSDGAVSRQMPAQSAFDKPVSGIDSVELPEGIACIEHIIFCGKDLGLRIHVNPANVAKLLPASL